MFLSSLPILMALPEHWWVNHDFFPYATPLLCHRALSWALKKCVTSLSCFSRCVTPCTTSFFPQECGTCAVDLPLLSMLCLLWAQARGAAAPMDQGPGSPGCALFVQIDLQQLTSTFCSSPLPFPHFVLLEFCKLLGLGVVLTICVWFLAQTSAGVAACCCNIND